METPQPHPPSCPRHDGDKGTGHLQRPDCLRPPRGSPESPCPHPGLSLGQTLVLHR